MSGCRRSARQQQPAPQFSCTPVTGHLPPAALYRGADGRYCVSQPQQQAVKHPVKVLSYDCCEPPRKADDAAIQKDAAGLDLSSRAGEEGGAAGQAGQTISEDITPLSRRTVAKTTTATATDGDRDENSVSANGAVAQKSTPNQSASSSGSARRLTLVLSSPESPPDHPRRSDVLNPALKRPLGTAGRPVPPPGPPHPGTPAGRSTVTGSASLTPGAFDSDEDDIFECELRSRIGDAITLLRGDTDLSAAGAGCTDGGGGSAEGSGADSAGGRGAGDNHDDLVTENDERPTSQRLLNFDNVADADGKTGVPDVPLPADAPPCRLPPARVTADNSLAARARHVVGRRPGERIVSELAELARSPGSPLLRQTTRKRARSARTDARSATPRGKAAGGVGNGGETPVAVKRQGGDIGTPRRQVGDARSPLVERRTNGVAVGSSPVLGRPEAGSGKTRGWIMSPESGVLRKRSDPNASGDGKSSSDAVVTSPISGKENVQRTASAPKADNSPRVGKSPLKRTISNQENRSPGAVRSSPRLVSRDTQSHQPAVAGGVSAAGGARTRDEAEDEDVACTQPVTGLVLDGVVAVVDVRSGADNRSEPVRAQLRALGALVLDRFTKQVTHVVFKDGSKATYDRARRSRLRLVSALWVDACRQQQERVDENLFPPAAADRYESPLFPARLRKLRSMQPRDFEEELAAADRRFRRRRRQQRRRPPPAAATSPPKRPAMTSPKRWRRRGTVEQLLTPRGQRSGSADPGSSEDDLPLNVRLFNRFMSPAGGWSTGGALRRPASPTAKLAAQVSASPDLEAKHRRANKTSSSHTSTNNQSTSPKSNLPSHKTTKAAPTKPSTSAENPASKPGPSDAADLKPAAAARPKRSLQLASDCDSDSDSGAAAVSAPPTHRRRRRRLMTPPESQSLLDGPLLQPATPAHTERRRRRPVAVIHPALRHTADGPRARTAPRAGAGGDHSAGGGGHSASGGSVRRLPAPRRSSLEFEPARPGRPPPAPRGRLVLTNLRSVERETLLPVISKLGGVTVMEEVTSMTTHVISGQARRTVSVLGALAVGAWLLSPDWVLASLEAGRWLPETRYEQTAEWPAAAERRAIRGTLSLAPSVNDTCLTETTFSAGPGVVIPLPGVKPGLALFAAVGPVFVSGDTRPPRSVLTGLVRLAGGTVAATARGARLAVGTPCRGVETVKEQWLMDSLQMNRLMVRQSYLQWHASSA